MVSPRRDGVVGGWWLHIQCARCDFCVAFFPGRPQVDVYYEMHSSDLATVHKALRRGAPT